MSEVIPAAEEALRLHARKILAEKHMTQRAMARLLNTSEKHLSQMLMGRTKFTLPWAVKLMGAVGYRLTIKIDQVEGEGDE